jgi:hypothetical protein
VRRPLGQRQERERLEQHGVRLDPQRVEARDAVAPDAAVARGALEHLEYLRHPAMRAFLAERGVVHLRLVEQERVERIEPGRGAHRLQLRLDVAWREAVLPREVLAPAQAPRDDVRIEPARRVRGRAVVEREKPALRHHEHLSALDPVRERAPQPLAQRTRRAAVTVVGRGVEHVDAGEHGTVDDPGIVRVDCVRRRPRKGPDSERREAQVQVEEVAVVPRGTRRAEGLRVALGRGPCRQSGNARSLPKNGCSATRAPGADLLAHRPSDARSRNER